MRRLRESCTHARGAVDSVLPFDYAALGLDDYYDEQQLYYDDIAITDIALFAACRILEEFSTEVVQDYWEYSCSGCCGHNGEDNMCYCFADDTRYGHSDQLHFHAGTTRRVCDSFETFPNKLELKRSKRPQSPKFIFKDGEWRDSDSGACLSLHDPLTCRCAACSTLRIVIWRGCNKWMRLDRRRRGSRSPDPSSLHPDDVMQSICARVRSRVAVACNARVCDVW